MTMTPLGSRTLVRLYTPQWVAAVPRGDVEGLVDVVDREGRERQPAREFVCKRVRKQRYLVQGPWSRHGARSAGDLARR
jgi:hypothetical protein